MKPVSIKQLRTHIGVTLLGSTVTSIDRDNMKQLKQHCYIYMMPWGFDVFHKDKKYGISFANAYQWTYLSGKDDMTYEDNEKRCGELCQLDNKANAQIAHHAV